MRSTTERGFVTYDELTDAYGSTVVIRESSAAAWPRVWLFCTRRSGESASPHLSVEQAIRVRDALSAFISEHSE